MFNAHDDVPLPSVHEEWPSPADPFAHLVKLEGLLSLEPRQLTHAERQAREEAKASAAIDRRRTRRTRIGEKMEALRFLN